MTEFARALLHLNDMLSYSREASSFIDGVTFDEFLKNREKQLALTRAIEVIGEAAKGVPEGIRSLSPGIEWRSIAGMRDKLIHHYFGIQLDTIWNVAAEKLGPLESDLNELILKVSSLDNASQ